jgi:hypothetical protein
LHWGGIDEFRAIYPEYKAASDDAIASKLNKTFEPDMAYENFSELFLNRKKEARQQWTPFYNLQELYLKRSDAYLKAGDWHKSAVDFYRAVNGFSKISHNGERWREFVSEQRTHLYVDMKTFDDAHNESVKFWIKETIGSDDDSGPYDITQYEMNCGARKLRTLSFAAYDASGNVIRSHEGGEWESIFPESRGEKFFYSACQHGPVSSGASVR